MLRNYVFVHVPKTGGTSLRSAILESFKEKGYLTIYDYGSHELTTSWLRNAEAGSDAGALIRNNVPHAKEMLLVGHFPASKFLSCFHPSSFFTILREPFAQIYSHYNHHVNYHQYQGSFEKFVTTPAFQNLQSRLCKRLDLSNIGFLGLAEEIESDLPRLNAFLGADLKIGQHNKGKYSVDRDEARAAYEGMVRENNKKDFELYETAKSIRQDRTRLSGNSIEKEKLSATWVSPHTIRGWAMANDGQKLVSVSLQDADGKVIATSLADIYRPDLQRQNILSHGVGGFEFDVPGGASPNGLRVAIDNGTSSVMPRPRKAAGSMIANLEGKLVV